MIIGFIGKKQSGKSTCASHLRKKKFYVYELSGPIKDAACTIFLWDKNEVEKSENKEIIDDRWGVSYRQILQNIGNEWAKQLLPKSFPNFNKKINNSLWVYRFIKYRRTLMETGIKNFSIPDIRFPEDVNLLKKINDDVYIIKVIRNNNTSTDSHKSESYFDKLEYDFLIHNDSTIENLKNKVDDVYQSLKR